MKAQNAWECGPWNLRTEHLVRRELPPLLSSDCGQESLIGSSSIHHHRMLIQHSPLQQLWWVRKDASAFQGLQDESTGVTDWLLHIPVSLSVWCAITSLSVSYSFHLPYGNVPVFLTFIFNQDMWKDHLLKTWESFREKCYTTDIYTLPQAGTCESPRLLLKSELVLLRVPMPPLPGSFFNQKVSLY